MSNPVCELSSLRSLGGFTAVPGNLSNVGIPVTQNQWVQDLWACKRVLSEWHPQKVGGHDEELIEDFTGRRARPRGLSDALAKVVTIGKEVGDKKLGATKRLASGWGRTQAVHQRGVVTQLHVLPLHNLSSTERLLMPKRPALGGAGQWPETRPT